MKLTFLGCTFGGTWTAACSLPEVAWLREYRAIAIYCLYSPVLLQAAAVLYYLYSPVLLQAAAVLYYLYSHPCSCWRLLRTDPVLCLGAWEEGAVAKPPRIHRVAVSSELPVAAAAAAAVACGVKSRGVGSGSGRERGREREREMEMDMEMKLKMEMEMGM